MLNRVYGKWQITVVMVLTMFFTGGCIRSVEDEVLIQPGPESDEQYFRTYTAATAQYEVINNFETRFIVQSTLLSSQFRKAFAERYQQIYNEKEPVLTEASKKTGFFVSIYTANPELNNLGDVNLWSVQLMKGNDMKKPVKIEKLRDKERWRPFFKGITPWSIEYLVLFDTPAPSTGDQDLVYTKETKLILSNQDGRVTVAW